MTTESATTQGSTPVVTGHRRCRARTRVGAALAAMAAVLVITTTAPAGAASSSPEARLQAAAVAMQQVPGYTFSASVGRGTGKVKIAGEYQAPDRIHEVVQIGTQPASEVVMIGSQVYAKDRAGAWAQAKPAGATSSDLRTTFAALKSAAHVKQSGKVITFTLKPKAAQALVGAQANAAMKGRATVADGHIIELRYTTKAGGRSVPVKIDYTITNPAPVVAAPI